MKDHEIRQVVNELTRIARDFGQTQQLRARISDYLVPILKGEAKVNTVLEAIGVSDAQQAHEGQENEHD